MPTIASGFLPTSILIASVAAAAAPAPNEFDAKVTAMRAAIICSDRQLEVLAKGTNEAIDEIAFAAMDNCSVLWRRAAAASAGDRTGDQFAEFSAGFLAAAHARYPDHAQPLISRWRMQHLSAYSDQSSSLP